MKDIREVYRYCNDNNISSYDIRGGTWFGDLDEIERYYIEDTNIKLGGTQLIKTKIDLNKIFITKAYSRSTDIYKDIEAYYSIPENTERLEILQKFFGNYWEKMIQVSICKDDDKLLELIKEDLSEYKYNFIKAQSFYNQKTMWLDNIISLQILKIDNCIGFARMINDKIFEIFILE